MKPANGKVIVRTDLSQKDTMKVGDMVLSTANKYENNHRYKSPTVCEVVHGNRVVKTGDMLLVHHNLLSKGSPFLLQDNLFSIPFSQVLFAKVDREGNIEPICGNILCNEIEVETPLPLPPELRTMHKNRYEVTNPGQTEYKVGDIVFTRPYAGYSIIWHWDNEQRSTVKVDSTHICGILKKTKKTTIKIETL